MIGAFSRKAQRMAWQYVRGAVWGMGAYLYNAPNRAEEGSDVFCILVCGLAAQTHCTCSLADQAWGVGHDPHYARIFARSLLSWSKSLFHHSSSSSRLSLIVSKGWLPSGHQERGLTLREFKVFPAAMDTMVWLSVRCERTSFKTGATY